jgi:DnaJ-class molecular chaperone
MHTNNYYEILQVSKDASQDEIKKAYRKLSMEYHPDRNPDGEDKFKLINEAYETLGNEEKRKAYDNPNPFGQRFSHGNPFSNMDDIISSFFDGSFSAGFSTGRRQFFVRGADIRINLMVKTKDVYLGTTHTIKYARTIKGKVYHETKTITIPYGCDNGAVLRLRTGGNGPASGDDIPENYGDLLIHIHVEKDTFIKDELNLIYDMEIDPIDLLIGKEEVVHHYDGDLKVTIPPKVNPNYFLRVQGKGFKHGHQEGDLMIRLSIKNDIEVSEALKQQLKQFKETKANHC